MKNKFIFITFLLLIISSVFMLVLKPKGKLADIYYNGNVYKTVSLSENQVIEIDGAVIEVSNGKIRFLKNNCKDKICYNTNICLPKGIIIKIRDSNYDARAY